MTTATTPLTAEQIAGIKAASENATPGPWRVYEDKSETVYVRNALGTRTMGLNYYSGDAKHIANCDPQTISVLCDLALRGLAPLPEGYALVPIEPTGEMWVAGRKAYEADAEKYRAADTTAMAMAHADRAPEHIYRAMIAASPAIPTARDGTREALRNLLDRYTALVNCGDCGNWNPETEAEVIAARAALSNGAQP